VVAYIVDNSVVVAWLYPGQATHYTERLLERSSSSTLHASFIWPAEFANAASVMVKRGILTDELSGNVMGVVANPPPDMIDRQGQRVLTHIEADSASRLTIRARTSVIAARATATSKSV